VTKNNTVPAVMCIIRKTAYGRTTKNRAPTEKSAVLCWKQNIEYRQQNIFCLQQTVQNCQRSIQYRQQKAQQLINAYSTGSEA